MKKSILFIGGALVGYALNTKTGKNLRMWAFTKVHGQINNLVGKINEVTESDSPSSIPTKEEEGK